VRLRGGVAAMPNTISGSRRGWQSLSRLTSPVPPLLRVSVVFHTVPQMGA